MGGKQKRPRQYILLFPAACLFLLIMAGCSQWSAFPHQPESNARQDEAETQLTSDAMKIKLEQQESQLLARRAEINRLKATIQTQIQKINELEHQIEQLKAVDLESEPESMVNEIP